jgi:hypothetical protein
MDAVCPENAELALVITAEIYEAAPTFAGTGQCNLMDRADALAIFILKQYNRLAGHRRR